MRTTNEARETRTTVANRLIPRIIGALMARWEQAGCEEAYRFVEGPLYVDAMAIQECPLWATVVFRGETVFRFSLPARPSSNPRDLFGGRAHVHFQRRGQWETALDAVNAPDIGPADYLRDWFPVIQSDQATRH